MPRDDEKAPVYRAPVKQRTQAEPQRGRGYGVPAWIKPKKDDAADNEPMPQPTQATRFNPTGAQTQPFTPPAWWNNLSNRVGNWIDNNVSGSQYVPAGLSQPQRPTTAAQFTRPAWIGGNQMQVSEPSDPSLPTGTFFSGRNTVRTGEASGQQILTTNPLNQRPRWSNGLAPAGEAGRPFQPSVTGYNLKNASLTNGGGSGGGGGYKKKGKGGGGYGGGYGGYDPKAYADRAPSWLMNLTNWNFKG